jgi:hypothetical protein
MTRLAKPARIALCPRRLVEAGVSSGLYTAAAGGALATATVLALLAAGMFAGLGEPFASLSDYLSSALITFLVMAAVLAVPSFAIGLALARDVSRPLPLRQSPRRRARACTLLLSPGRQLRADPGQARVAGLGPHQLVGLTAVAASRSGNMGAVSSARAGASWTHDLPRRAARVPRLRL